MSASTYELSLDHSPVDAHIERGNGATYGGVSVLLRLEGAVALTVALIAYRAIGGGWLMCALLFLLPDLSMLGYLVNRKFGAALYNGGHSYVTPAALAAVGWSWHMPELLGPALIWAAHIGFDRLVGYGLKYGTAFGATHLGWKGKHDGRTRAR